MSFFRRFIPAATLAIAIAALYLYKLDAVGVLGPDEPRYAAIGLAMARSKDFITPRLWGSPWFEKPPLLYWMAAFGSLFGLGPELSARLPVVLLSLAFLCAIFALLRREFGSKSAGISTLLLGTCAGWLSFSSVCLTDIPLAVAFSLAAFVALPLMRGAIPPVNAHYRLLAIGVLLGLATLAKGLVPLALSVPFFWFLRHQRRNWWIAFAGCAVVALPWYAAVYVRNGRPFIDEFFLKHHLQRLYSASLQHVQPWYYYFPVLLAGLFPWTPLAGVLASGQQKWDARRRFLGALVLFGFVLFSLSLNKLPGYLLPLLPPTFALIGAEFEARDLSHLSRWWLVPCAILIGAMPLFAPAIAQSLAVGRLSTADFSSTTRAEWFFILAPIAVVFLARRIWVLPLLSLCVVGGGIYLKDMAYPILERDISARAAWREIRGVANEVCDGGTNRDWLYGLSFYRGSAFVPCDRGGYQFALRTRGRGRPFLDPLK